MNRRIPPLNGLRAFEAAARHLSFSKAAEELHVTPAAISQQVKVLEDYFEVQLFNRLTRALSLTEASNQILPKVTQAFDDLVEVDRVLRGREQENQLLVSVGPAFATKWLLPRLDSFRKFAPQFELRIDATDIVVDIERDNVDVAIRYGRGQYAGLESECLLNSRLVPVCSPALLKGDKPLLKPGDLVRHTLLHSSLDENEASEASWAMWLKAAGLNDIDPHKGPHFNLQSMALQAAIESQGVALVDNTLAAMDVERGNLVILFAEKLSRESHFCQYLVYPKHHLQRPKVKAFREWLFAELN